MIYFYTGTPGSGKSLHIAKTIYEKLRNGVNVISNVNIDVSKIPLKNGKPLGAFIYVPFNDWYNNAYYKVDKYGHYTPCTDVFSYIDGLYNFSKMYHVTGYDGKMKEHQTLLVLDECQELFNPRSWNKKDRLIWIRFFRIHRHLGYDCLLSSQDDKSIDKQIRPVLQTQVLHRKLSNYKLFGKILSFPFGGNLFICIESMYGMAKKNAKIKSYFMIGEHKYFDIYNSYEVI